MANVFLPKGTEREAFSAANRRPCDRFGGEFARERALGNGREPSALEGRRACRERSHPVLPGVGASQRLPAWPPVLSVLDGRGFCRWSIGHGPMFASSFAAPFSLVLPSASTALPPQPGASRGAPSSLGLGPARGFGRRPRAVCGANPSPAAERSGRCLPSRGRAQS